MFRRIFMQPERANLSAVFQSAMRKENLRLSVKSAEKFTLTKSNIKKQNVFAFFNGGKRFYPLFLKKSPQKQFLVGIYCFFYD